MSTQNFPHFNVRSMESLLNKKKEDFQREDLLWVITESGIKQINLHYIGLDGRLQELKVPVNNIEYAELILAQGERIDGSSIFKGILDVSVSDLYIVPIYKTAFVSPFEANTMGIMCSFLDKDGAPASFTPDNILFKAHEEFKKATNCTLNALGELEFYIIYDKSNSLFAGIQQGGYHQSTPFVKRRDIISEIMNVISTLTGAVKYAHSEVGYINRLKSIDLEIKGKCCEQYEIEFLPCPVEEMAMFLVLGKWIIRNIAYKWGCSATFTPKLEEGIAGNGLHIHLEVSRKGKNAMTTETGKLSAVAKKLIGGLCKYAPSISAFGNSVSSAYLRLVTNQEAPTQICWSEFNRSALIRVPLGWANALDLGVKVNPNQVKGYNPTKGSRQTVELRSPDGSAYIHLLLAAITLASKDGLTSDDSLELAEGLHVVNNVFNKKYDATGLRQLPKSCAESADFLLNDRNYYEADEIFPSSVIEFISNKLYAEDDRNINERFSHLSADERLNETRKIMHKDLHKH